LKMSLPPVLKAGSSGKQIIPYQPISNYFFEEFI
jgi:hypothetical protein